MAEILCIGHSAYDLTLPLNYFPEENTKYSIDYSIEGGGGPASNGAYLLSKWGIDCAYIGLVGDDIYGQKIKKEFLDVGTDISLLVMEEHYSTPFSTIIVNMENGSRTLINRKVPHEDLDIDPTLISRYNPKVLLLDGHELTASLTAMKLFPDTKTVLDAGSLKESTRVLAEKVDYLICSEKFALSYCEMNQLTNKEEYEICIDKLRGLNHNQIVVTLGDKGLIYDYEGKTMEMVAYPCEAKDTTAAGDVFHGAFAFGLLKDFELNKNLKFSSLTSALSVTKLGGRQSIPELERVIQKLSENIT